MRLTFLALIILLSIGKINAQTEEIKKVSDESLWGVPISPELLNRTGKLNVPNPQGEFSPEGEWEQSWKLWIPGRDKSNSGSGYLKVKKEIDINQSTITFKVDQLISEYDNWFHFTRAEIAASSNLSGSPVRWKKGSQYFNSPGDGSKNLTELDLSQKGFIDSLSEDGKENFTSSFTVFDLVQKMSAKGIDHLDFTLLDELDKVKRAHSISFAGETSIQFAGETKSVRCYEGIGEGLLPCKYYLDQQGRMLLAISGMRVFILSQGCESAYDGKFNPQDNVLASNAVTPNKPVVRKKPNILFITTDQQAWNTMSAVGNTYIHTPSLDRLANAGVTFSKSYSPNPVCSPTRACWITGLTSSENGVITNGLKIIEGIKTVGHVLTENGYETVFAGKLHVGIPQSYNQKIPGFSKVLCEGIGGKGTLGDQVVSSVAAGYLLNRDKSKPFYLAVNFLQPHDVCNWTSRNKKKMEAMPTIHNLKNQLPPLPDNFNSEIDEPNDMKVARVEAWSEMDWRYYLWNYYRMVEEVDAEIGRVLNALEESGELDNTVVIFNSDHGEGTAHHRSILKNFPYDEACRVPFVISYPRELKQGVLDERTLVTGLDVVPTICDFAGVKPPENCKGISVRKIAAGKNQSGREFIVSEMNHDKGRMIRTADFKFIAFRDDPNVLLFDMKNDPGETTNLAQNSEYRQLVEKHIQLLEDWEKNLKYAPIVDEVFTVKR
jgi:arylsulfatase A-like enzyme